MAKYLDPYGECSVDGMHELEEVSPLGRNLDQAALSGTSATNASYVSGQGRTTLYQCTKCDRVFEVRT